MHTPRLSSTVSQEKCANYGSEYSITSQTYFCNLHHRFVISMVNMWLLWIQFLHESSKTCPASCKLFLQQKAESCRSIQVCSELHFTGKCKKPIQNTMFCVSTVLKPILHTQTVCRNAVSHTLRSGSYFAKRIVFLRLFAKIFFCAKWSIP